ncbi:MAG: hypothetical protein MSC30_19070 [Gaiellaceae bacterium MAG52_C11]|nr:hypothetical protein [Candidatus Gaiellasilicea maunaloa]
MDERKDLNRDDTLQPTGAAVVDIWTFRTDQMGGGDIDLTGYSVEATDGGIGKIDEATYEAGGSYLVVDTGPWIFGKKVLLPAGVVDRLDPDSETVFVSRTKDEIKNAPEYDEGRSRDDDYRGELGGYYGGDRSGL